MIHKFPWKFHPNEDLEVVTGANGMVDKQATVLVDLLAHKDPHLRVLEIGAGTGGATLPILSALGGMDSGTPPRFLSYDVTDITTGFFEKLQEKTAIWGELISYKKLDIEQDIEHQGFETEHYDLVVAANVLHATTNMSRTMANVRTLLKPGGTLILIELIPTMAGLTNIFGIFDGCKAFSFSFSELLLHLASLICFTDEKRN